MRNLLRPIFTIFVTAGLVGWSLTPSMGATKFPKTISTSIVDSGPIDIPGLDSDLDLLDVRIAVTQDNDFVFSWHTRYRPVDQSGDWQKQYGLAFDTDLDGVRDYSLGGYIQELPNYDTGEPFDWSVWSDAEESNFTCDAWMSSEQDSTGFRVDLHLFDGCFEHGSTMNVRFSTIQSLDDDNWYADYIPAQGQFSTVKSTYLAGVKCSSKFAGSSITYLGKDLVCQKAGSKYKFVSKGSLLAKKAKFRTDFAYYSCAYKELGANLNSGGRTLVLSGALTWFGLDYDQLQCVFSKSKFPSWLIEEISMTRAIDGLQKGTYKYKGVTYVATWTYHPDDGLNLVLRKK